jgi:hypothetical protein
MQCLPLFFALSSRPADPSVRQFEMREREPAISQGQVARLTPRRELRSPLDAQPGLPQANHPAQPPRLQTRITQLNRHDCAPPFYIPLRARDHNPVDVPIFRFPD